MENMEKGGVIIIGGSAGSIEVIMNLFPVIPADFTIPIVVVLHRKNTSEHHLEDVLSRKTKLPVLEVQDKMQLMPGNIYIAPGDYHLLVGEGGELSLDYSEKINFSRPSINVSFEEFAKIYGPRCIGILLSGANSDGAEGLNEIKKQGGLTIVQSPDSAKVATMPMAALNLFQPDLIADLQKMNGLILEAANYPVEQFIGKIKNGLDFTSNLPSVLLVDDLEENLFSLNAILKSEGYLIDKARSGFEALQLAQSKAYDCIVLDVQMPEMDGFELAKKLSENEITELIPIIFLSALGSDKEKVVEGLETGAIDFLAKPPDPLILKAKIKNCLNISRRNKERSRKLSSMHNEFQSLKEYTSDVSASFRYAQNIQRAILPTADTVSGIFPNNFIFYKPKEAIGGDFYYVKKTEDKIILVAGDCTGHGVPGAMMSMMSVNILKNIIETRGVLQPSAILEAMTKQFGSAFKNEFSASTIQDGLEISVVMYDTVKKILFFSAAGSRVFLFYDNEIIKLRGSSIGINGSSSTDLDFLEHRFDVSQGFKIYMFSDGVVDQFGGPNGKKFTTKRLEKLICSVVHQPMLEQQEIYKKSIQDWLGTEEQIDDILFMGFSSKN